jgi:hypothetical protein
MADAGTDEETGITNHFSRKEAGHFGLLFVMT